MASTVFGGSGTGGAAGAATVSGTVGVGSGVLNTNGSCVVEVVSVVCASDGGTGTTGCSAVPDDGCELEACSESDEAGVLGATGSVCAGESVEVSAAGAS